MTTMRRFSILLIAMTLIVPVALADDVPAGSRVLDAEAAYDILKQLEGTWEGEALVVSVGASKEDGVQSTTTVKYETIANDTSVMATFAEGKPMEMVSLYHLDGQNQLVHTHYCAVGNQPTMRFKKTDEPGVIKFDFASGTNMDVTKDGHVHGGTMKLNADGTLESATELWNNGKLSSMRYTKLTRKE